MFQQVIRAIFVQEVKCKKKENRVRTSYNLVPPRWQRSRTLLESLESRRCVVDQVRTLVRAIWVVSYLFVTRKAGFGAGNTTTMKKGA